MDILKRLKVSKRLMIAGGTMLAIGFVSAVLHDTGHFDRLDKEQLGGLGLITGMLGGAGSVAFTIGAIDRLELGKIETITEF